MFSIDEGIQIDRSDEQDSNADLPRIEILEPDSNVKSERSSQLSKHESEMISMDEGIQIDRSDEQSSNADLPRIEILQPDSNVKSERFSHQWKQ
jgi:hypothetical protein